MSGKRYTEEFKVEAIGAVQVALATRHYSGLQVSLGSSRSEQTILGHPDC